MKKERTFKFSGAAALFLAIGLIGFNVSRVSGTTDKDLLNALKFELSSETTEADLIANKELLDTEDPRRSSIWIKKVLLSRSILSNSSNQKVIANIDYNIVGQSTKRKKYLELTHSILTGWQVKGSSSAVLFYLNFF